MKTLYVHRPILNAADLIEWAKDQGLRSTLTAEHMHVTVVYSETPLDWPEPMTGELLVRSKLRSESRGVERFGDDAIVLTFDCADLADRHEKLIEAGAVPKWPTYRCHVTLTYDPGNIAPEMVEPYAGRIVLGGEVFAEVTKDWADAIVEKAMAAGDGMPKADFEFTGTFAKADMKKGQAFGFASIAKIGDNLVIDGEEDTIDPLDLEEAAYGHAIEHRIADENHDGSNRGTLIETMVFTPEKCAAMQEELRKQGIPATIDIPAHAWWIGHQITDIGVREKVESGEYQGFSIGGTAVRRPAK